MTTIHLKSVLPPVKIIIMVGGRAYDAAKLSNFPPWRIHLIAADAVRGGYTVRKAMALTGAKSQAYVNTALRLTPGQRALVETGRASLAEFHTPTNTRAAIERFIVRKGPTRVMEVARAFAPAMVAAE